MTIQSFELAAMELLKRDYRVMVYNDFMNGSTYHKQLQGTKFESAEVAV